MNRQEETTKSLKTTQLAQGRTELPPQKDDALGHHILTLLLPDSTSWSMGKGLHARDVTDYDPSEGEALQDMGTALHVSCGIGASWRSHPEQRSGSAGDYSNDWELDRCCLRLPVALARR
jgi:hypothetical protein